MTRRLIALCLALASLIPACLHADGDGPEAWPKVVKLGVIPTEGGADSKLRFEPLRDHLQACLGVKVEVFSAGDYSGVITAMAHNHIDFAFYGPKSYTEAAERANAEVLAMELDEKGNPGYTPIIIARKGAGIDKLDQAKGKTFAFTDPNSTSGCLVPSILFSRDLKIDPQTFFREVSFSGSHGASILAVKNGNIDVAATNDIDLGRMIEKGAVAKDDLVIIHRGNPLPGAAMACRKDLPASLKMAYLGALLTVNHHPETLAKLKNGGYAVARDSDYDIVRYLKHLKRKLEKGE
jgi:phosphonate transport system substrate-binding protein